VGPAHGSLLLRFAIPLALVIGWTAFARRPRRLSVLGAGVVVLGIAPLFVAVDGGHRGAVAMAAVAAALSSNLRGFAAEFHPWNRRAKTVHEKLRVTGLVVLVTSLASLALTGGLALSIGAGWMPATELVPTATRCRRPTIVLGMIVVGALPAAWRRSASASSRSDWNFTATTPLRWWRRSSRRSPRAQQPHSRLRADPGLVPATATVIGAACCR
jgi:hypothetical protein